MSDKSGLCVSCGHFVPEDERVTPTYHVACFEAPDPEVARLTEEVAQDRASFDLRWRADMRAIKRWQEAHPGNELVWPDHADMVVWLLGELEKHEARGEAVTGQDIAFLESLAKRLADALYYGKLDAIGLNGSVSPGLRHDDYDLLRKIAKAERIANLKSELAALEAGE